MHPLRSGVRVCLDGMVEVENAVDYWLYASRSVLPNPELRSSVSDIVAWSRRRNPELMVTGALIFTGSFFAQYIEGPVAGIRHLMEAISRDDRHTDIRTISTGSITQRRFADWSLAYAGETGPFDRLIDLAR